MINVLVVDDDFMVAKVHQGFVERIEGFTVTGVAGSGARALSEVDEVPVDLVLLDIYLPDISGLEVLRRLRQREAPLDVLVVTAARDVETVRAAMRGGVVHYLIKPFTFDHMRQSLERYASARRGLPDSRDVHQTDVDRMFGTMRPSRVDLPKGLARDTALLVSTTLRASKDDLSASECAALAGLSRVAARRYLEHFVDSGKALVQLRYGSTGRPQRRYRWKG